MSCYPAVVRPQMTIMDDRTLIEVVRSGCGDDVADLLQDRLADAFATKESVKELKHILSELQIAITSAESAASDLEDMIAKEDWTW